jgi:hypothetical protein
MPAGLGHTLQGRGAWLAAPGWTMGLNPPMQLCMADPPCTHFSRRGGSAVPFSEEPAAERRIALAELEALMLLPERRAM